VTILSSNVSPIPILTYHQIAPAPPKGTPYRSLVVAPLDFARQMAWLKLLGYRGLSMPALMPYLRGERQGKVVGITFDDGYLNNLTHALPVLQRQGFSATCYVVSQRLGQSNVWDREIGIPASPLMTLEQLKQWIQGGQDVGAHTRHHVHLPQLSVAECEDEIALCKSELEAGLGVPVAHFCYPYGDYTPAHAAMVQQAGFESATTTARSRSHTGEDLVQLPRVPIARRTTRLAMWVKLATSYEDKKRV
jgi:peptidoglycan/xylan/chitin deacetylase (PgdA/CDA1 family)